ncbi:MAG: hypothetical protein M0D57_22395 [Sphingobacteriales bacterium JAD_PAG50586_3]|nr:MAG: hypothetical protein M0D57_22395 [Sphingobacteriales bacterium JAD_PAG50586_3]
MKKVYSFIAFSMLIGVVLLNYGCGEKNTIKKTFKLKGYVEFPVDATTLTNYDQTQILDVSAQASDFAKHRSNLISVVLDSVKCFTREYLTPNDSSVQINNASIKIGAVGGADEVLLSAIQNVNLTSIYEKDGVKANLNNDGIAKFSSRLTSDPYTAQIRLQGDVNQPVNFKIQVNFFFTFAAWIL